MAVFKVTWQFSGPAGSTWNELYYAEATSVGAAANPNKKLIDARLAMLSALSQLERVSASDVTAQRVTAQASIALVGTSDIGAGKAAAPTAVAAVCTLGTSIGSRKIWLRGWVGSDVQLDAKTGRYVFVADVTKRLKDYFEALKLENYGMRRVKTQTPGPLQAKAILKVDGTAKNGTSIVTLDAAPGFPFPGRVIISGCSKKDLPDLNGRWSLLAAPIGSTFQIRYQTPLGTTVDGGNGKARQEDYQVLATFDPAKCAPAFWGTRDTRNPTTRSRGARRAVRIRTSL